MEVEDLTILEEMWRDVDIVVNIAATTNFDERYDISLALNTFRAEHVYNFALKCSNIKLLLHVSTAYVCREKSGLMEDPYKMGETLNGEGGLDIYKEKQIIEDALSQLNHKNAYNETIILALKELGIQRSLRAASFRDGIAWCLRCGAVISVGL
ncbi:fatty acyl-CoA reductase 3-like [Apium graveolens]|uniref:fatty acyl-CoA reductase 3-like n=1 Tax=Apium graveolens TaxID=4045 RepID=UPI003D7A4561